MKKMLFLTLLAAPFFLSAQVVVNGVDVNQKPDVEYLQLVAFEKPFSQKVVVTINYGQLAKFGEEQTIKGPDGKNLVFNNVIDSLNFMVKNGWEYVNSYPVNIGNTYYYHYLLRKKQQ